MASAAQGAELAHASSVQRVVREWWCGELKSELRRLDHRISGRKDVLLGRLMAVYQQAPEVVPVDVRDLAAALATSPTPLYLRRGRLSATTVAEIIAAHTNSRRPVTAIRARLQPRPSPHRVQHNPVVRTAPAAAPRVVPANPRAVAANRVSVAAAAPVATPVVAAAGLVKKEKRPQAALNLPRQWQWMDGSCRHSFCLDWCRRLDATAAARRPSIEFAERSPYPGQLPLYSFTVDLSAMVMTSLVSLQQYRVLALNGRCPLAYAVEPRHLATVLRLQLCRFGLADSIEACKKAGTANFEVTREWAYDAIATRKNNLAMNQAMDASRESHELEQAQRRTELEFKKLTTDICSCDLYKTSVVLGRCRSTPSFLQLCGGQHRHHVTKLLDLELKVLKWYPMSRRYFEGIAGSFALLDGEALRNLVCSSTEELEGSLLRMPEVVGGIPRLFLTAEDMEVADDDDIVLVSAPGPAAARPDKAEVEVIELD